MPMSGACTFGSNHAWSTLNVIQDIHNYQRDIDNFSCGERKMNRGRIEILRDMLVALDGGGKKTHLMFRTNITHKMVERYIAILLASQCARKDGEYYHITEKGQNLRDAVTNIIETLEIEPEIEEALLQVSEKSSRAKNIDTRMRYD